MATGKDIPGPCESMMNKVGVDNYIKAMGSHPLFKNGIQTNTIESLKDFIDKRGADFVAAMAKSGVLEGKNLSKENEKNLENKGLGLSNNKEQDQLQNENPLKKKENKPKAKGLH